MEVNFDELRDWSDGARRALDRERERMMEQMKMLDGLARATEVIGDTLAENERLQTEVDDLRPATATAGGEKPAPGDGATAPGDGGACEAHGDSQPLRGGQQFAGVQRPGER